MSVTEFQKILTRWWCHVGNRCHEEESSTTNAIVVSFEYVTLEISV